MNQRFVNDRQEIKYLVREKQAKELLDRLARVLEPDSHGGEEGYYNHSIYFDSPRLTFYREKVEGLAVRVKPRIRIYRNVIDGPAQRCFLEFKHRDHQFTSKERTPLPTEVAARLLDGDILLSKKEADEPPLMEEFRLLIRRLNLRASAGIRYHRTAYSSPLQSGLRITVDRRLECTEVCDLSPVASAFHPIEPASMAIIEIKYNGRAPGWLLNLIATMELGQVAYSKYVQGIERLNSLRHPEQPD